MDGGVRLGGVEGLRGGEGRGKRRGLNKGFTLSIPG